MDSANIIGDCYGSQVLSVIDREAFNIKVSIGANPLYFQALGYKHLELYTSSEVDPTDNQMTLIH